MWKVWGDSGVQNVPDRSTGGREQPGKAVENGFLLGKADGIFFFEIFLEFF